MGEYLSDIPPDFWDPIPIPIIHDVRECFSSNKQTVNPKDLKHLPAPIQHYLIGANRIGASGNGFCFMNACLALLCIICPAYADVQYDIFLKPYKNYLHDAGEENVENPNTLDTDKAAKAFRFLMYQIGKKHISFLVLYDDSYKFSPELDSDGKAIPYTDHLFVLILQSGHFTAIDINKSKQSALYAVLLEEEKKDNTLRVSSEPLSSSATKADLIAMYNSLTGENLIDFDGTLDYLQEIIKLLSGADLNHVQGGARLSTSVYSFDGVSQKCAAKGPTEASPSDIVAMFNSLY